MKENHTTAPIIVALNWGLFFKIMCDASDFVVVAVMGHRRGKYFQVIYYASRILNDAQQII